MVVLVVALNQMRLRSDGLSSWKGGGFGMYAEMHPVYTKLFVKARSDQPEPARTFPTPEAIEAMETAQLYRSDQNLEKLREEYRLMTGIPELAVQVWLPVFNLDSCTFELQMERQYY